MGHPYMCAVVVALQFLVFRELVHVRDNPAKFWGSILLCVSDFKDARQFRPNEPK